MKNVYSFYLLYLIIMQFSFDINADDK